MQKLKDYESSYRQQCSILRSVFQWQHPTPGFYESGRTAVSMYDLRTKFNELRRAYNREFPDKIGALERFIASALRVIEVIPVPPSTHPDEDEIRDPDDRPILRAAIKAGVDNNNNR